MTPLENKLYSALASASGSLTQLDPEAEYHDAVLIDDAMQEFRETDGKVKPDLKVIPFFPGGPVERAIHRIEATLASENLTGAQSIAVLHMMLANETLKLQKKMGIQ